MNAVSPAQRAFLGNLSLGMNPKIVDVGANVGEWALAALDRWPKADITCVEPQPTAFKELESAAGGRFRLENVALVASDTERSRPLWVDADRDVLGSFHKPGTFIPGAVQGKKTIDVRCQTLRRIAMTGVDLLKLDAEGNELEILRGAEQVLSPRNYRIIEWEYNQCAIGAHVFVHDFWVLLTGAGYQVGVMNDDGLVDRIDRYDMALEHVTPAREFVAASAITDEGKVR